MIPGGLLSMPGTLDWQQRAAKPRTPVDVAKVFSVDSRRLSGNPNDLSLKLCPLVPPRRPLVLDALSRGSASGTLFANFP